ncbi:MAG: hypothetical protein RI894_2605 [Bacteroidota bacterium]
MEIANETLYMQRALQLAQLGAGYVSPNPQVGAVIVCKNRIIGEGYHRFYGGAHAEVEAIKNVAAADLHLLAESAIYVTLEPCFHTGKTPPCVDLILKHRIPTVIIACLDPNPLVGGQSVAKLRAAGVRVEIGVLEAEAYKIAASFLMGIKQKRPYIILKWAQSVDGFIGKLDKSVWLTNEYSKRLVHKWRSEVAAIAVGANTIRIDNPSLTTRLWPGKSPARVTWLRQAETLQNALFFSKNGGGNVFLFQEQAKPIRLTPDINTSFGINILQIEFDSPSFFSTLFSELHRHKIDSILIEGGLKTLQTFIDNGVWDEARVFTAPIYLKDGIKAPVFPFSPANVDYLQDDKLAYFYQVKGNDF